MDTVAVRILGSTGSHLVEILQYLGSGLLAIISAYLAYRFARRQNRLDRSLAFVREQVTSFYAPMVGLRRRIAAQSLLRKELDDAASVDWRAIADKHLASAPDGSTLGREFVPFDRMFDYNNRELVQDLIPRYVELLDLFTKNYWLAESSTQIHYQELVRFVGLWQRHLDKSLPVGVLDRVGHSEDRLKPLYDDLEATLARLTATLKEG